MNDAKIGIFWYYKQCLIISSLPVKEVESIGGFSDLEESHYNFWTSVQNNYPELRMFEYEEIPRGRVLRKNEGSVYFIYSSTSLANDKTFQSKIIDSFSLQKKQIRFVVDEHYEDPSNVKWEDD